MSSNTDYTDEDVFESLSRRDWEIDPDDVEEPRRSLHDEEADRRNEKLWYPRADRSVTMPTQGNYPSSYPMGALVHFTAGRSERGDRDAIATAKNAAKKKYCFFSVSSTGKVFQTAPLSRWGYHSGKSRWPGLGSRVHKKIVGIEVCNAGHLKQSSRGFEPWWNDIKGQTKKTYYTENQVRHVDRIKNVTSSGYYLKYTPEQERSLIDLILWMHANNPNVFNLDFVVGHDEVSPSRKNDPGGGLSWFMPEFREMLKDEATRYTGQPIESVAATAATTTASKTETATSSIAKTDLPGMNPLWVRLRDTYAATPIEFPVLKGITMAQWTLESGWAKSPLAVEHLNFGGLKYREFLADICTRVSYKGDDYCKFDSIENFFQGYWRRFDAISAYKGWRGHTDGPRDYIRFIADIYAPPHENHEYLNQIFDVYARLEKAGQLPVEPKLEPKPDQTIAVQPQPAGSPTAVEIVVADASGEGIAHTAEITPVVPTATVTPTAETPQPQADSNPLAAATAAAASVATAAAAASATAPVETAPQTLESTPVEATAPTPTTPTTKQPQNPTTAATTTTIANSPATTQIVESTQPPPRRKLAQLIVDAQREPTEGFIKTCSILEESGGRERDVLLAMVAHWGTESQWGRSDLAKWHFNFAGIEWSDLMADFAAPVKHPTKNEPYCRFLSYGHFVRGYLYRRAADPGFDTSSALPTTAENYLNIIAPVWRPNIPGYADGIMNTVNELRSFDTPTTVTQLEKPDSTEIPATQKPAKQNEFIIQVRRFRTESNNRKTRTVATYHVTLNGQKLPGLEGHLVDPHGPSDNGPSGRANKRRIEPGKYPLWTHYGSAKLRGKTKYKTHHHTTSGKSWTPSIVSIALRDTGYRAGILIHPATGLHSSAGCLHPSRPLHDENDNISWTDSRNRVLALKKALEDHLIDFPKENARRIPNAWIEIHEDPSLKRRRSRLEARTRRMGDGTNVPADISDEEIKGLNDAQLFEVLSDAIDGSVLPGIVSLGLFERILSLTSFSSPVFWLWRAFTVVRQLNSLRGNGNENLWQAWVNGWTSTEKIQDVVERQSAEKKLLAVAKILLERGVDINDRGGLLTALTFAARGDSAGAIIKLVEFGADINLSDRQGNAPLVWAAFEGAASAVSALVNLGANLDVEVKEYEVDNILTRQPRSVSDDQPPEEIVAERPPVGADLIACAKAGRDAVSDDPQRQMDYRSVIATLRKGK